MTITMSKVDLLAGLADGRLSERTALLWLQSVAPREVRATAPAVARSDWRTVYAAFGQEPQESVPEDWNLIFPEYARRFELDNGGDSRMPMVYLPESQGRRDRPPVVAWDGWINAARPGDDDDYRRLFGA